MGPAIEKAKAAQVAAMMVRIFMGFPDLPIGWSSFFIVSSRPCRPADYGHRTGVSRDEVDVGPGSIMNTASVARTEATAATAIAMYRASLSSSWMSGPSGRNWPNLPPGCRPSWLARGAKNRNRYGRGTRLFAIGARGHPVDRLGVAAFVDYRTVSFALSSRTNADDRLPRAPLG